MRWLADENIPRSAIAYLRHRGEDVVAIGEEAPGLPDVEVIRRARDSGLFLLSFDRDHGDLIFRQTVQPPPAVVYLRVDPPLPDALNALLAALLALGESALHGRFTVVTPQGTRQRSLPRH